jgi:cytochrome c oxidase cbb3-type subunit III
MSMRCRRLVVLTMLATGPAACERERRDFRAQPAVASAPVRLTDLQPGQASPPPQVQSPYRGNAYGLSEGKRLFGWYNCVGCHHHGGGGIGPALMDHRWIYGSRPEQIFSTIVQGRPNGMPSYGGRLTEQQVWEIVAYVESMSGNVPKDAAPGRDDDMSSSKPESRREPRPPTQTGHR